MKRKMISILLSLVLFLGYFLKPAKAAELAVVGAGIGIICCTGILVVSVVKTGSMLFSEHTKNHRPSNWNKHTKPRAGRETTKNRQKPNWNSNVNKRPK